MESRENSQKRNISVAIGARRLIFAGHMGTHWGHTGTCGRGLGSKSASGEKFENFRKKLLKGFRLPQYYCAIGWARSKKTRAADFND